MKKIILGLLMIITQQVFGQDYDLLQPASSVNLTDKIALDQGVKTRWATLAQIQALIGGGGGGGGAVSSIFGRTGVIVATEGDYSSNQLSDFLIASSATGQLLRFNGTNFVNTFLIASDIPNLDWSKITTGKPTTLAGYGITDAYPLSGNPSNFLTANQSITLSGDVTGTGTTAITTTIAANAVTTGKILDGTIATTDLANASVTVAKVNATGTASSSTFLRGDGSWQTPAGGGGGTVNSVALTAPSIFTVTGSPITNTGTIDFAFNSQTQNTILAAPSGASGVPTFRTLVSADIPNLDAAKTTTGTFADARIASAATWNAKQNAITTGTISQYFRGDLSLATLDKTAVGLGNVDNTTDLNKPISTATQTALNAKENTITAGTTSQYYRGDKTMQTLDKTAVGLANVDNTSDVNKPVSTATQTALNLKENSLGNPASNGQILSSTTVGVRSWVTPSTGSVTSASVATANGFNGSVATATTTPAITIGTTVTGVLKGNGTAISAAVAGTDYLTPTGSAAGLTSFPTLNQNTTGTSANVTGTVAIANGGTGATTAAAGLAGLGGIPLAGSSSITGDLYKNTGVFKIGRDATNSYIEMGTNYVGWLAQDATYSTTLQAQSSSVLFGHNDLVTPANNRTFSFGRGGNFTFDGATARYNTSFTLTNPNDLTHKSYVDAQVATKEPALGNPSTNGHILSSTTAGVRSWIAPASGGSGTVTSASVVSANGFAGTVATATTTPAITLSTSVTGILKGNGTALQAATLGADFINNATTTTFTGDVAGSGSPSTGVALTIQPNAVITADIANNAVTYAKMQNVTTARIMGRITAASGVMEELTGTQATSLLDNFTSTLKGLVPLSGGGTTNFLRADGTWATPAGGGSPAGSTGQVQFNNAGAFGASSNLFWDNTNVRLGIGTNSPSVALDIRANTPGNDLMRLRILGTEGFASCGMFDASNFQKASFGWASNSAGVFNNSLFFQTASGSTSSLQFATDGVTRMFVSVDGLVGFGTGTSTPSGQLHVRSASTSTVTQVTQAIASQTANLAEYQNSAGTALLSITPAGNLSYSSGIKGILHNGVKVLDFSGTAGSINALLLGAGTTATTMYTDGHLELSVGSGKLIDLKSNTKITPLAGTGDRAVIASSTGQLSAVRYNRTLAAFVTTATRSTTGETDYGSFPIPANTLTTDGDAVTYSLRGDALVNGQKSFKIYFGASLISEAYSASGALTQATITVTILRNSSTTATVFYPTLNPSGASQNVPSAGSLTGLDFTAAITIKSAIYHDGGGGGSSSITARAARVTFEPAP